jgi:hypothetical protein
MKNEMLDYIGRTLGYKASGRLRSPKEQVGRVFINPDGGQFVVFRQTVLAPAGGSASAPAAMFRVQFKVPGIRRWRDRLVISLKSPIFVGAPGFRSKLWMVDERNDTYQGVYEWDTVADAEAYKTSASMDFMTEVAVPGGISCEVIPGGRVVEKDATLSIEVAPAGESRG